MMGLKTMHYYLSFKEKKKKLVSKKFVCIPYSSLLFSNENVTFIPYITQCVN